ncbi:unnamed protein product [Durusdinium trenchii]|uniref:Uncharacterized protein n=1 Tax=Durusdinium trenchii TaxID=1381693 RepID=A0ABP0NAF4_9DINO
MSTKQPVSPSGEDILELLEATTAPEQRLSDHLHAPQLLRWSLCSGTWRAQLARSPAWRRLARWRFGEQLELTGPWPEAWGAQLREDGVLGPTARGGCKSGRWKEVALLGLGTRSY